jgi:transposase
MITASLSHRAQAHARRHNPYGIDVGGRVIVSKRLRRDAVLAVFANLPPGGVGIEACATAH